MRGESPSFPPLANGVGNKLCGGWFYGGESWAVGGPCLILLQQLSGRSGSMKALPATRVDYVDGKVGGGKSGRDFGTGKTQPALCYKSNQSCQSLIASWERNSLEVFRYF